MTSAVQRADEIEQPANGYITDTNYIEWRDGIFQQVKNPMFSAVRKDVKGEEAFPYAHLEKLL